MKSIMDYLEIDLNSLTNRSRAYGPSAYDLSNAFMTLNDTYHFYGCTQTVDRKYKIRSNGKITSQKLLYKMSPDKQIYHMRNHLKKVLNGMVYCGFFEFTAKGVVHCHLVVAHPTIHVKNSVVMASIYEGLQDMGKVQYCKEIASIEKYWEYITKDYDPSLNNIIMSDHFEKFYDSVK